MKQVFQDGLLQILFINMKITLKKQLQALSNLFTLLVLLVACLLYIGIDPLMIKIYLAAALIFTLPTLALHISYFNRNKNMIVMIDKDKITIELDGTTAIYYNTEIEKIIISKSAAMDKGGIPMTPFESYFYAKVIVKNKPPIYLTNLLDWHIDDKVKEIENVQIIRHKALISTI